MRYENVRQNGVAKKKPENMSVHACVTKVLRLSPTSSGIDLVFFLRVSWVTTPRFHALELLCFNFGKWMGIRGHTWEILGRRRVQNHTRWPFRHQSLHTCDVSDHVTQIEAFHRKCHGASFQGIKKVRNSPYWTEFMIGTISVDQYDAVSERHPVIRELPFKYPIDRLDFATEQYALVSVYVFLFTSVRYRWTVFKIPNPQSAFHTESAVRSLRFILTAC